MFHLSSLLLYLSCFRNNGSHSVEWQRTLGMTTAMFAARHEAEHGTVGVQTAHTMHLLAHGQAATTTTTTIGSTPLGTASRGILTANGAHDTSHALSVSGHAVRAPSTAGRQNKTHAVSCRNPSPSGGYKTTHPEATYFLQ